MYTYDFYKGHIPHATVADVERCILTGKIDPDGIGQWDWLRAIVFDDTPEFLIQYIIQHKHEPAIAPLYIYVRNVISGILDKD